MKKHFAWRPHLDRDPLFNPFVPSEHRPGFDHIELAETYGEESEATEESTPSAEAPSEEGKESPESAS